MKKVVVLVMLCNLFASPVHAQSGSITVKQTDVMNKLLATYADKAKEDASKKKLKGINQAFTAEAGREFYLKRRTWQLTDYTCSGCHTEDPRKEGKHIDTGKAIKPLAPSVNPERFTDVAKVEKNFTQHCMDLHERDCLAFEKGQFIAYLMSVK